MPEHIPNFDLYGELEVASTASTETIEAAWRSLVKRHHPDVGSGRGASASDERIRRLNVAHDWLTDPERRARYDAERTIGAAFTGPTPTPASTWATPAEEPDWRELRREVHWRSPPARSRSRPLTTSPIFAVALGLLVITLTVGAILVVIRLPSPGAGQVAGVPVPSRLATASPRLGSPATATATPIPAEAANALAAQLPDSIGGIALQGETASGSELFDGDDVALADFLARTGGSANDLVGAYKAGSESDGRFVTVVGLAIASVSGEDVAAAFKATSREGVEADVSWTDTVLAGRTVAVSRDPTDPEISAYLVASSEAMYLVITPDPELADAAILALP